MFKSLLCSFSMTINTKVINITMIINTYDKNRVLRRNAYYHKRFIIIIDFNLIFRQKQFNN